MFLASIHRYRTEANITKVVDAKLQGLPRFLRNGSQLPKEKWKFFFPAPKANLSQGRDAKLQGLWASLRQPATEGEMIMHAYRTLNRLALTVILLLGMTLGVHADATTTVDTAQGVVRVSYPITADTVIKVMVAMGSQSYTYDLLKPTEAFPLQFGDGSYKISLYQRVQGTQYRLLTQSTVLVDLPDDFVPFLGSSQILNWTPDMVSIGKAKAMTINAKTDAEKVQLVYGYVTAKIKYDYAKISKLKSTYVPSIEDTYATNLGICYDYSALFGSMLRSVGVPAKLIKGYKNDIPEYHAWNQVYLDKKWVYIDTTYDAAFKAAGVKANMLKTDAEFRVAKYY